MKVLSIIVAAVLGIALAINLTYDPSPKTEPLTDLQAELTGRLLVLCGDAHRDDWDSFTQCEQATLERAKNMSDEEIVDLGRASQEGQS